MKPIKIPFNKPYTAPGTFKLLHEAIETGKLSGDGVFTARCHEFLEDNLSVRRALLTPSCTHALELSSLLLDLGPEDEVIVPTYTFVSTVNAFVLRGCRPAFADCRPDTLNLDEKLLPELTSDRTKAIVVMHYGGVGCEMDYIVPFAHEHGLSVIEDNAHGLFAVYKGKNLGTLGNMSTLSFHETKNFSSGEGGALLINSPEFVERAEIVREKGTNRTQFFRGDVDRYSWVDIGSSYLPSELTAAFLYAQFKVKENIQTKRMRIWEDYYSGLSNWAGQHDVLLPVVPQHCKQSYHLFYIVLPDIESRGALIKHLKERGILAVFHYVPLHSSPMGKRLGGHDGQCPVAERISTRLLRLPMYNELTPVLQGEVIEAVKAFTP